MPWGEIVTFSLEQWILNLENRNIWYLLNLNFTLLKKPYNQGQYKDHLASVSDQERQVLRAIIGQKLDTSNKEEFWLGGLNQN